MPSEPNNNDHFGVEATGVQRSGGPDQCFRARSDTPFRYSLDAIEQFIYIMFFFACSIERFLYECLLQVVR